MQGSMMTLLNQGFLKWTIVTHILCHRQAGRQEKRDICKELAWFKKVTVVQMLSASRNWPAQPGLEGSMKLHTSIPVVTCG